MGEDEKALAALEPLLSLPEGSDAYRLGRAALEARETIPRGVSDTLQAIPSIVGVLGTLGDAPPHIAARTNIYFEGVAFKDGCLMMHLPGPDGQRQGAFSSVLAAMGGVVRLHVPAGWTGARLVAMLQFYYVAYAAANAKSGTKKKKTSRAHKFSEINRAFLEYFTKNLLPERAPMELLYAVFASVIDAQLDACAGVVTPAQVAYDAVIALRQGSRVVTSSNTQKRRKKGVEQTPSPAPTRPSLTSHLAKSSDARPQALWRRLL